jgi:sigma-B regulation protein RsbQ
VQHRYLSLDRYVTDLLEVLEALTVMRAVLVGHSVGAMICALAPRRSPDRVARLVLIAASPRYLDEPGYRGGFTAADLQGLYSAVPRGYAE